MSLLIATFGIACHNDIEGGMEVVSPTKGSILLAVDGGVLGVDTRAEEMADTDKEAAVTHLDVMIFNDAVEEEEMMLFHHERITTSNPDGTVRLGVDVNDIVVGARYWVYVVANSTLSASDFANIGNAKALLALNEETFNLHLTASGLQNTPSLFLMDGVAYMGASEPATTGAITIAEQQITDVVTLKVKLRRAAAKVVVHLSTAESNKMRFAEDITGATPGYYMRNTPCETRIINDGVLRTIDNVETTHETISPYYKWVKDSNGNITGVEITTYVYSHTWDTSDSFSHATNLLVDIPAYYTTEVNGESVTRAHPNNYYQVPLSKEFKFERNHYYSVTANVHAPGAEDFSEPVEVQNLKYSAYPWTDKIIDVGGEGGPEYLKVNLDFLKMFNTNIDATSLRFASSSPVTIAITECYYIDKFGVRQELSPSRYNISGSTNSGALSGNITVTSDVPQNNTIRYFTLRVVNESGQEEIINVEQYPLVYIVNILGHYSYRDDFKSGNNQPTTIHNMGSKLCTISLGQWNNTTKEWSYNYANNAGRGFWSSKVVTSDYINDSRPAYNGRSRIQYFSWNQRNTLTYGSDTNNPGNARMYHVRITATSGNYKLGVPRMITSNNVDYEFTDPNSDNAGLVSPSFMTASRLGKVDIQNYGSGLTNNERRLALARNHCAQYVEVDREGNVYDNWRLPTASELEIIMELQGTANESADAIDYLLNADYYMAASGLVYNSKRSNTTSPSESVWAIRCIRNAY